MRNKPAGNTYQSRFHVSIDPIRTVGKKPSQIAYLEIKYKKIHTDQKGRIYIKESFFINSKMEINKVYVIDGIPEEEFYENNASDIDHMKNGDLPF